MQIIDKSPRRISSFLCAQVLSFLSVLAAVQLSMAGETSILPDYRPSSSGKAGSVALSTFRPRAASSIWESVSSFPADLALRQFLSARIARSRSPGHLVISTPGSTLPEQPIDPSESQELFSDPGLVSQVSAQLLPPSSTATVEPSCLGKLAADRDLIELVAIWLTPLDYPPAVFSILCELRRSCSPREWSQYRHLALAIALVADQLPPPDWPHSQVARSCLPSPPMTPVKKFKDLILANQNSQLKADIRELSVGDLIFLVDHQMPKSELEWFRERYKSTSGSALAARAYSDVKYDTKRESAGAYDWPSRVPYTAENILKAGGICIDQAFFAAMACRALGIPAASFAGAGDDGGHAWVGFLSSSGWDFSVGRPEGKYIVGRFSHPQGWVQMTDHDLEGDITASPQSRLEMGLARLFASVEDFPRARAAAEGAVALSPHSPAIWRERNAIMSSTESGEQTARRLKEDLRRRHLPPSIKSATRLDLAEKEISEGNLSAARSQERTALREASANRTDLGVEQMAAAIRRQVEARRPDRAIAEYKRSVASLPEGARGEYFYAVVVPLVNSLVEGGSRPQAVQVAKLARRHLSPPKNSLLDRELSELEKKANWSGQRPRR